MIKYFNNIELKRSSIIILMLSFLTFISSFFILKLSYENIKTSYIESSIVMAGEIVKTHPELGGDILPIITKGASNEKIRESKKLLKEYGLSEDINIDFIHPIYKEYQSSLKKLISCLSIIFIIEIILNTFEHICIYRKMETLILASKNMMDFKFQIGIYENSEGTFAKLAHTFKNMRVIMKNNFLQIQKEKVFLEELLSDISHQLKTPIASLLIYNDILLNRNLDENKKKEFLNNSEKQLNRIEWLIKSLLQLARLDAGVIKFEKNNYDINKTVQAAVDALTPKALQEKVSLKFQKDNKPIMMKHDVNWISEGIINLIKNAVEHTKEQGSVQVYVEETATSIKISVKDNGEGIPKDEIPNIFKRFYKGKGSRKTESVGIGLALSKSIIEGHKGIIEVKSKEDQGSIFTIVFLHFT